MKKITTTLSLAFLLQTQNTVMAMEKADPGCSLRGDTSGRPMSFNEAIHVMVNQTNHEMAPKCEEALNTIRATAQDQESPFKDKALIQLWTRGNSHDRDLVRPALIHMAQNPDSEMCVYAAINLFELGTETDKAFAEPHLKVMAQNFEDPTFASALDALVRGGSSDNKVFVKSILERIAENPNSITLNGFSRLGNEPLLFLMQNGTVEDKSFAKDIYARIKDGRR